MSTKMDYVITALSNQSNSTESIKARVAVLETWKEGVVSSGTPETRALAKEIESVKKQLEFHEVTSRPKPTP